MSGEPDAVVGPARRAFAELSEPAGRLLSDFAAAEDGAGALEPELLLLELDVFGGIAIPTRAARGMDERRARGAQAALARLAGAAGGTLSAPDRAAQRGRAPGLPDTDPPRGSSSTAAAGAPAGAEPLPPVFPLRGGTAGGPAADGVASGVAGGPAGGAAPGVTEPPTAPAAAVQAGAVPGVATTGTPPRAAPEAAAPTEATGGTLELIGRLTEAILAAKPGAAAAAPSTAGSPAPRTAETGTDSSFLAETLRSLGGQTAAAFGVESAGAPVRATPAPTAETTGASAQPELAAPSAAGGGGAELGAPATPAVPENGTAPRAAELEPDPAALAALVNDALVEQARRHGLELG